MKDITVLDVLQLPIMANAQLKAGQKGLSNIVSYVNVLDNYYDESDPDSTPVNYGQNFYLTSMFHGLDNPDYIRTLLKHFVDLQVSAICIIDEYLTELPQWAYDIADKNQIPIIFIDSNTPYALIISSIMELKLSYQESELHENLIHELLQPQCSDNRREEIISSLSSGFLSYVTAYFCRAQDNTSKLSTVSGELHLLNKIRPYKAHFACPYKNGTIIIRSQQSKGTGEKEYFSDSDDTIHLIHSALPESIIGVSEVLPLNRLNDAILQSCIASASGSYDHNHAAYYKDLGMSRLFIKLIGTPAFEEHYQSLVKPVQSYDKTHQANLLDTIIVFVEKGFDHIKTGKALHIHENTVRYRLNKIKELIPYGKNTSDFQQSIYFLYKVWQIKKLL